MAPRTRLLPALVAAVAILLSGCAATEHTTGSPDAKGNASTGPHNAADLRFAQEMLPHHEQALQMVRLTAKHTVSDPVQTIANGIRTLQEPQTDQLRAWLAAWGAKPASMDSGMPGMVDQADLDRLAATTDTAAFERLWLQLMVQHHQGAITMAETEVAKGENADAIAMAKEIERIQKREITRMEALIGQ